MTGATDCMKESVGGYSFRLHSKRCSVSSLVSDAVLYKCIKQEDHVHVIEVLYCFLTVGQSSRIWFLLDLLIHLSH